ncbi:MAG TPA: sigma-70 family RNA polymerase sigma factor [Candidatus Dormibacteraeota bacterium]
MSVRAARIEEGREDWLADLYQAHAGAVQAYCRRFLNSPDDAADATHEVFVRAIGSLQAPARGPQARRWLITVAQNYCLDLMRRRRRMQSALTVLASDGEPQYDSESEVTNRGLLQAVLSRLGCRERQALWQSAVEHRSVGEIAASLGISYMAAAQVLHRARKHATAIATKLAAILGLAGANAFRRRPRGLALIQTLAAVAVVPVVIAVGTPSSSGNAAGLSKTPTKAAAIARHGSGQPAGSSALVIAGASMPDANERQLRFIHQQVRTTVNSLLSTVTQNVQRVTTAAGVQPPAIALPSPPAPVVPTALPTPPPLPHPPASTA